MTSANKKLHPFVGGVFVKVLRAGPVYEYLNPVTQDTSYIGTHVSYAARIEPITPPGKVYSSQAFAALASSMGVQDFTCDYVGQIPFAKGYGTFPTYHVRRQIQQKLCKVNITRV